MRYFREAFLGVLFLGLALTARPQCGCDPDKTLEEHLSSASVVILGTCINVTTNPIKGGMNMAFQVDSSWIRAIEPNATFHTNAPTQCGASFEVGKDYLVFGKKRHQTVETTICEPNMLASEMDAEILALLGKGFAPGRPQMARNMNLLIFGLGMGALLFVAFVVLRKRIFTKSATKASNS